MTLKRFMYKDGEPVPERPSPEDRGEVLHHEEWGDGDISLELTAAQTANGPMFGAWLNAPEELLDRLSNFYLDELERGQDLSAGINPLGDKFPHAIMGPIPEVVACCYATMGLTVGAYYKAMLERLPKIG